MAQQIHEQRISQQLRKAKVAKLFRAAEKYGVIKRGWSCIDYMRYAAKTHGWESTCISGPKGTLKSNLLLQHGLAMYGSMDIVKRHFITSKKKLLELMNYAINNEICIPWVGIDDAAALFPKSLYFTQRKLYSKLQSAWETVRTVFANFEFTCVIKRKVATFLLEDITGDIKTYNPIFAGTTPIKSHYDYRRWLWRRNFKDPTTDIAQLISVEDIPFPATPDAFKIDNELSTGTFYVGGTPYKGLDFYHNHACLHGVETHDFIDYWNDRLALARESYRDFATILEESTQQQKLTPEQRKEQAIKAINTRWHPEKQNQETTRKTDTEYC